MFRRHQIRPFPGGMTPPPWTQVPSLLSDWVRDAGTLKPRTSEFPEQLATLHCRFEEVHPFLDGNGRTGRLALNLLLVRLGYPPAVIYKSQRPAYLKALQRADAGESGPLAEMLARAILDNLYRFILPAVAGPDRLVPLTALATPEINEAALRTAAIRGRLQATLGPDSRWRSTREWVDAYLATRYRRDNP